MPGSTPVVWHPARHEKDGRLAIRDDENNFGRREPPIDRRHDYIGLHRAQQQFEKDVAVLAEKGDPRVPANAKCDQPVGNAVGQDVEFSKTGLASLEFEGCFPAT